MAAPRPNQRAIARACGVSNATVSRALGGHPRVRAATRERVRAAARDLGYEADPRLAFLSRLRWSAGRKPETVRVIVLTDEYTRAPANHAKFREIRERARELGYRLEQVDLGAVLAAPRRFEREWHHAGIGGILISVHRSAGLPAIDWNLFSVVIVGEEFPEYPFYRVGTDFRQGFDLAGARIVGEGKPVGYCFYDYSQKETPTAGIELSRLLLAEILLQHSEFRRRGLATDTILHLPDEGAAGKAAFAAWRSREKPGAVMTNSRAPLRWTGPSGPAFFLMPKPEYRDGANAPGCHFQIGRRLALGLATLHENLLFERRGFAATPTKLLVPMRYEAGPGTRRKRVKR